MHPSVDRSDVGQVKMAKSCTFHLMVYFSSIVMLFFNRYLVEETRTTELSL